MGKKKYKYVYNNNETCKNTNMYFYGQYTAFFAKPNNPHCNNNAPLSFSIYLYLVNGGQNKNTHEIQNII